MLETSNNATESDSSFASLSSGVGDSRSFEAESAAWRFRFELDDEPGQRKDAEVLAALGRRHGLTVKLSDKALEWGFPRLEHSAFVFPKASWSEYEAFSRLLRDRKAFRMTYAQEMLEVRVPGWKHEIQADFLHEIIGEICRALEIEWVCAGSVTLKREDAQRAVEGDKTYYFGEPAVALQSRRALDLTIDPPPDLVVEVDVTSMSDERMGIYATLGVREVWRLKNESLIFFGLGHGGVYEPIAASAILAGLAAKDASRFLEMIGTVPRLAWLRRIGDFARDELQPRRNAQE